MSCDFGVWSSAERLSDAAADDLYGRLCEDEPPELPAEPAIDTFYAELTSLHPEIDDVPEERIDDTDLCPWSIAFDRSPGHLLISCVWSKAEYVESLLLRLSGKHRLTLFNPQTGQAHHPKKPWWRHFW